MARRRGWFIAVGAATVVAIGVAVAVVAGSGTGAHEVRVVGVRRTTTTTSTTTTTTTTTTSTTTTTTLAPEPDPAPPPTQAVVPREPAEPREPPEPAPPPEPVIRVVTYSVETDGPVSDPEALAAVAAQAYADPRGWSGANIQFQRVDSGGSFTLVLANAENVPNYAPGTCDTMYSCQSGRYVVVNDDRFTQGSPNWPGPLDEYRRMVVNHETGHWMGLGHAVCSGAGDPAPVMQQQSIDMQGCATNAWPLEWELARARR